MAETHKVINFTFWFLSEKELILQQSQSPRDWRRQLTITSTVGKKYDFMITKACRALADDDGDAKYEAMLILRPMTSAS